MKVLLLKDVYGLGRAGDVKKVANGYGRNFLLPQKLAVLVAPGALMQVERIKVEAAKQRELLNEEMAGLAEQLSGVELNFKAKVGETGKLYGSVSQQMISDALSVKIGTQVDRHWIESQPLREVGEHMVKIRLTFDLVPEVKVIVESEEEQKKEQKKKKRKPRTKKSTPKAKSDEETATDEEQVKAAKEEKAK
ncbi:MAG TPA: 50S ribosomal protein L9 [Anaerolineae bacterium]|nr:50S ribosomal protein L9 [Anaerolineae bacterium]